MNIVQEIATSLKNKMPFVAYKKPMEDLVSGFFQESDALFYTSTYEESGFIFAPFDDKNKTILIPLKNSRFVQSKVDVNTEQTVKKPPFIINEQEKNHHIDLVQKGIDVINQQQCEKIVLSRVEEVTLKSVKVKTIFINLLRTYPSAFVYLWYHPKIGLWLGATPEVLVKIKNNMFETMSLAGTQQYKECEQAVWTSKEIEEQQYVTNYIVENITLVCNAVNTSKTKTVRAGSLLHLQTKISGSFNDEVSIAHNMIKALHPTPAVCGLPKLDAKNFILIHEPYNREYYTGFLGELNLSNKEKSTNLFVNLRCMQLKKDKAFIYVGGGVTKDSNAVKEFEETVAKSGIMKSVL